MVDKVTLANPLSCLLDKEHSQFTRADLLKVVTERSIERFGFHYTGIDGQLKELKLPFSNLAHAEQILASGERVDGSSLFKGLVDASCSDLYVVPSYKTAFINPFNENSLDFLCRFLDRDGQLAPFPPDNILEIAHNRFKQRTNHELHALGELEFFLIGKGGDVYFTPQKQAGYHASSPFFKGGHVVTEMVRHISQITGSIKYTHAEVGYIDSIRSDRSMLSGKRAEQHEIEFLPCPIEEMGDFLVLAKWIIRNVAYRHGMLATFVPKLEEGVAGNGFHVHMALVKDGKNVMSSGQGELSENALKLIGGLVHYASTLSAFGNTVASAFLRLVPNQEAPTRICWSHANRSALIRVPLGWLCKDDLSHVVNPDEPSQYSEKMGRQTVEIRSPDGSAMVHLLLAGLTTAAEYGMTADDVLDLAARTKVQGNIFDDKEALAKLEPMPSSCVTCSDLLDKRRAMYQDFGVFPESVINYVVELLKKEKDTHLNSELGQMSAEERLHTTRQLMHQDIHRH